MADFSKKNSRFSEGTARGSWDGAHLALDNESMTVRAGEYNPEEVAANLDREFELAYERSDINEILARLPYIPGGRDYGAQGMPVVQPTATTAKGIAEAMMGEIRNHLTRSLGGDRRDVERELTTLIDAMIESGSTFCSLKKPKRM